MSFDSGQLLILEDGVLTDRTTDIYDNTQFTFTVTRGRRGTATIPIMIYANQSYLPQVGWPVWIYEVYQGSPVTTQAVFVGSIDDFQFTYFNDAGDRVVTLTVTSLEQYFDTIQTPAAEYKSMNAGDIFTAIFNAVISQLPVQPPITLGTVDAGVDISDRVYNGTSNAAADFQQLATDSAYIWYVDPRDQKVYFHAHDSRPSTITITSSDVYVDDNQSSIQWSISRADFRSTQVIQMAPAAVPGRSATFLGDGSTTAFTMPELYGSINGATISTGAPAGSTGTVTGTPSDGDTITITPPLPLLPTTYIFRTNLDNTQPNQILINAAPSIQAQYIVDGINANPLYAGTRFSGPSWPAPDVVAQQPSGASFVLSANGVGPSTITVSTTSAAFSWSDSPLATGAISGVVSLSVGVINTGTFQLYYSPNSSAITVQTAIPVGVTLTVTYLPVNPGQIATSSDAATSLAINSQFRQFAARGAVTPEDATQQAAAELAAYSVLPKLFQFQSDTPGLFCGDYATVALTTPADAAAVLNGQWLVQEVQGDWIPGFELNAPPFACHFRYTYQLINTTEISTYQDTLATMIDTGPFIQPGLQPTASSVPAPNPTTAPTDSGGGAAASTMTPAQAWVQEQLGFAILQSGDDLVAVTSTTVSSASYTFVSGDVGRLLDIVTAAGWTPGLYLITGVTAGVATLGSSPATGGATGGKWGTADTHVFQFTWAPGVSFWTNNPIAIVMKLIGNGDSPLTFKAQQLTPFDYAEVGYATSGTGPGGSDYVISGDQLTVRDPLSDSEFLLVEYFPDSPTKLPHRKAGDAPPSGLFVAIATGFAAQQVMTSDDAVSWTPRSSPTDPSGGSVIAFAFGKYTALCFASDGVTSINIYSTDGISWLQNSVPQPGNPFFGMAVGAGVVVGLAGTGEVVTSADAINYTLTTTLPSGGPPGPGGDWADVCFGDSLFCAVGFDTGFSAPSTETIATSSDGSAWTIQNALSGHWQAIAFGAGVFCAVSSSTSDANQAMTSSDAVSWAGGTISAHSWQGIAFGAGTFVAVSTDGTVSTSPDGLAWSDATVAATANANRVRFVGGEFVVCTAAGIVTSPDGFAWTAQTSPLTNVADVTA